MAMRANLNQDDAQSADNLRVSDIPVVLAVDDMATQTLAVKKSLPNYNVVTAKNAKEALDFLAGSFADLILLDIEMPEMSGIEMFEKMQENPDFKSIPVIFVTSSTEKERVQKALTLGAKDFIAKPFTPDNLQEKVRRVLGAAKEDQAMVFLRRKITAVAECCGTKNLAAAENTLKAISPDVFSKFLLLKLNRVLTALHNRDFDEAKTIAEETLREM